MRSRLRVGATLSAVLLIAAIPATNALNGQEQRPAWNAPRSADAHVNPLAGRSDVQAGGAKLYGRYCAQCHRDDGTGTSFGPGLTGRRTQTQSDGALFWKISGGNTRSGMPTFSGLPELQRWQLVMHLRALESSHRRPTSSR